MRGIRLLRDQDNRSQIDLGVQMVGSEEPLSEGHNFAFYFQLKSLEETRIKPIWARSFALVDGKYRFPDFFFRRNTSQPSIILFRDNIGEVSREVKAD